MPLYRLFCQATGYGGTVQTSRDTIEQVIAAYDRDPVPAEQLRPIRVSFNTDVASGLEWSFRPAQREVVATPGESVALTGVVGVDGGLALAKSMAAPGVLGPIPHQ